MTRADAIRLHEADNVATVLRRVTAGETLHVRCGTEFSTMVAQDAIPLCHKISLNAVEAGQDVVKYGHRIGVAAAQIGAGHHVHIHNLHSARARVTA